MLGVVCVALGSLSTIFYVSTIRENHLSKVALEREADYKKALGQETDEKHQQKGKTAGDWLKET